jgi:hypothetical protein
MPVDQILRMVLHAHQPGMFRTLEAFDQAVGRPGNRLQAGSKPVDDLVMEAVDLELSFPQSVGQSRAGLHPQPMTHFTSRRALTMVTNVLHECAAERHVDELLPAADG